ncbi:MAG: sporulation protein YqfD, partial [Oscillospiraceae bacterium]|nr:sporulation protein YqfD [Oscillospiraceae bacterium]
MLIRFLRFWRGTMEFQISGKYLERFLNLAARARIPIWDGRREEQVFYGKTLVSNGPQLRQIAEKVQLQWQQSDYKGAPQLQKRYRKRFGIAGGGILLLILMLLSQQFVWTIRVKGNAQVSDTAVIQLAEQLGLRPGVWKKSLDVIEIADELTVQLEQVSWAAINLLGTVAEVEIVERVMPPEVLDEETPCNV